MEAVVSQFKQKCYVIAQTKQAQASGLISIFCIVVTKHVKLNENTVFYLNHRFIE